MFTAINGVTILATIPETECDFIKCTIIVVFCTIFICAVYVVYGWCINHSVTDDRPGLLLPAYGGAFVSVVFFVMLLITIAFPPTIQIGNLYKVAVWSEEGYNAITESGKYEIVEGEHPVYTIRVITD